MMKTGRHSIALIVVLLVAATNAFIFDHKNQDDDQLTTKDNRIAEKLTCINRCQEVEDQHEYLRFESGKTYEYKVKITNQIVAHIDDGTIENGESIKQNLIQINGTALFNTLNQCEVQMMLDDVEISFTKHSKKHDADDHNDDEQRKRLVQQFRQPIIFSYKDGIVTEVCSPHNDQLKPEVEDELFATNIKKSIISALQTRANILNEQESGNVKVIESDYHGDCETEYHLKKPRFGQQGKYSVVKRKNLLTCTNVDGSSELSEIGYFIKETKQAETTCRQEIDDRHVVQAECRSERSLNSLLDHIDIDMISKVQLIQQSVKASDSQSVDGSNDSDRKGWTRNVFGLKKSPKSTTELSWWDDATGRANNQQGPNAEQVLGDICENLRQNSNRINLQTPEFVQKLSQSLEFGQDAAGVWQKLQGQQGSNICDEENLKKLKDIFIDTAASVLNENTVSIVRDEMLRLHEQPEADTLAQERLRYLATSLAFAQNPNPGAVQKIVPELLEKIHEPEIVLSISALIKHVADRDGQVDQQFKEQVYKMILDQVLEAVQKNQPEQSLDVVNYLQALANVPTRSGIQDQERLLPVITGQQNDQLVRTLAIKSLQGVQPTENTRQQLLNKVLADSDETNEIRIAAYRTLINTGSDSEELQQILRIIQKDSTETGNRHVYNYVCSHQKSLKTSQDMSRRAVLPSDAPQFPEPDSIMNIFLSRHYEYSTMNDKQIGSIFETDLVMANNTSNFGLNVPRSITANLTLQFGGSANGGKQFSVAEVTVRQEGFEKGSLLELEKILKKIPGFFTNQDKTTGAKFSSSKMIEELTTLIGSTDGTVDRRLQLLMNIDGKNIYVYDSRDQRNRLGQVWQRLQKQFPIRIDETMVVMPFSKRFHIAQTSSGVPMYFDVNTTYIGTLEAMIQQDQNQTNFGANSNSPSLEMMLKPTIVVQTMVGFGNGDTGDHDHNSPMSSKIDQQTSQQYEFSLVNRMLVAPTIHFKTELQEGQLKLKFFLPEAEQRLWFSETKIVHGQSSPDDEAGSSIDPSAKMVKCSKTMMQYLGASICYKTKENRKSKQTEQKLNEIVVDYNELVLRKQHQQMDGIEFIVELPPGIFDPTFQPQGELKFGFTVQTPSSSQEDDSSSSTNQTVRFQTKVAIHVPENKRQDQLSAEFIMQVLSKKFQGQFSLLDRGDQQPKLLKFQLQGQKQNKQMLRIDINGQIKPNQRQSNGGMEADFNLDVQPFQGSKVFSGKGYLSYQEDQPKQQQNLVTKFTWNGQQVLDMAIVQDGQSNDSYQLSGKSAINFSGFKLQNRALFNLDPENIKLVSRTSYNKRSGDRNQNDDDDGQNQQVETFDVEYQSSKHEDQRLFLYKMMTSQFPQMNVEINYHGQIRPEDSADMKFLCKYGSKFERNQLRINTMVKKIQNVHSKRGVQYEAKTSFEFKPKNLQLEIDSTADVTETDPKQRVVGKIQVRDVQRSQTLLESDVEWEKNAAQPFAMKTVGEIKLPKWGKTVSFKHDFLEDPKTSSEGKRAYGAKFEMTTIDEFGKTSCLWPKRLQGMYRIQTRGDQAGQNATILEIWKNIHHSEHEIFYENCQGHYGHVGLLERSDDGRDYRIEASLKRDEEQVYVTMVDYQTVQHEGHEDGRLKFMLDTTRLGHLKLKGEFQLNSPQHQSQERILARVQGQNQDYKHKTLINLGPKAFEVSTETARQNGQTVLKILTKMETKMDAAKESSRAQVEFKFPWIDVEHSSQIRLDQDSSKRSSDKSIDLESQTLYKNRNILKFNFKSESNLKEFQGEFGGDLRGQIKVLNVGQNEYQMNLDISAPQKQIVHQTMAKWQKQKYSAFNSIFNSYRLLAMDMKNYLGKKLLVDVHYKRNNIDEDSRQTPEKYDNHLMISTTTSHGELSWSPAQALIIFQTKLLGGIDHQTELVNIDLPKALKFFSKTRRNDRKFLQVNGDLQMRNKQKSAVEVVLGEDQYLIHVEYVPEDMCRATYQSKNGSQGQLKYSRLSPKHWLLDIRKENNRKSDSDNLKIKVDHECDRYTKVEYDSKLIQGRLEHNLEKRSLLIDLKGQKNEKFDDFQHKTNAKWNENGQEMEFKCQTDRSNKKLLSVDAVLKGKRSLRINADSNVAIWPLMLTTLVDLDDRHVGFRAHDKKQDKHIVLETRAKSLDNFLVQCSWGQPEDQTKKVLLETVASSTADGNRKELKVMGQFLKHSLESEYMKQNDQGGSRCKLQAKYNDLETNEKKSVVMEHRHNSNGKHIAAVECRNGATKVLQGKGLLDIHDPKSMNAMMETETDLKGVWDSLNCKANMSHRQTDGGENFRQTGSLSCGNGDQEKSILIDGQSDQKSTTYKVDYNAPNTSTKIYKLEWNKPQRKLQINVFDENGRILDVNVDVLAKAVQKKFQIVSFIDQIPTIDVEAAFGENSRLVFEVSFRKEKKLELVLNWFGQWRKDYRAEALFRCMAEPQFEMMISSHHPAHLDNVDAVFKYKKREIKAKLINEFGNIPTGSNYGRWKRVATIEIDGRKALQLSVDRSEPRQHNSRAEIITYDGKLDGDYQATGKAQVVLSKQDSSVKMIRIEMNKDQSGKKDTTNPADQSSIRQYYLIEMLFRYQERPESTRISGLSIEKDHGQPILVATYVEPPPGSGPESTVNTLTHLLLPGGVDYQILNQITYKNSNIQQVSSQLKKRGMQKPLAIWKISHDQDKLRKQFNVLRFEIQSPEFRDQRAKVFQILYTLDSDHCDEMVQKISGKEESTDKDDDQRKCSSLEMIFGDQQAPEQKPVSVKMGFSKELLADQSHNRTMFISVNTLNESSMDRVLNFTVLAHASTESLGYWWENVNRFGNRNFGHFYFGMEPRTKNQENPGKFDLIYRCDHENNHQQDSYYRVHLETKNILSQSYVRAKLNIVDRIKQMLTGAPRTEQISKRKDVCEWRNRMIRVLKDELQYKWRLFKRQTVHRDLINAISDEIMFVRGQMKTSQDPLARKIIQIVDLIADKLDHFFRNLNLERTAEKFLNDLDRFLDNYKTKTLNKIVDKCDEYEGCRKLYRKFIDYEIHRIVRNTLNNSMDRIQRDYMPKSVANFWTELQRQTKPKQDLISRTEQAYHQYIGGDKLDRLWRTVVDSFTDDKTTNQKIDHHGPSESGIYDDHSHWDMMNVR